MLKVIVGYFFKIQKLSLEQNLTFLPKMNQQNVQIRVKPSSVRGKKTRHLRWYHVLLLKIASSLIRLWTRTLRFQLSEETKAIIASSPPPLVAILWHNRLFVVPEFYRRYVHGRKLATVISASNAGAWLSGLFKQMGIHPIRGSRNRRGTQAFREMLQASKSGYDVGVTPDGSRGPIYDMKAGAATLALRTKVPVVLLSYNFQNSFRLNSWDRFYIPYPFSCVEVQMELIEKTNEVLGDDPKQAAKELKVRLQAITRDSDDDFFGVVI